MTNHRESRLKEKSISPKSRHNSNSVRIIGGEWRGRKLAFPNIKGLRPTGDRMRETLFNWIAPDIHGANVIDLFAGSGALGLESLSRGASQVTFIELNSQAAQSICDNLELLSANHALVKKTSALDYLQMVPENSYDLLFLDPPFAEELHNDVLALIDKRNIMKQDAWVYIEAPATTKLAIPSNWTIHREKTSGQVRYLLCYC